MSDADAAAAAAASAAAAAAAAAAASAAVPRRDRLCYDFVYFCRFTITCLQL